MKKFLVLLSLLTLGASLGHAGGWSVSPPSSAPQGTVVSTASGSGTYISGVTFLIGWYQNPAGTWTGQVMGTLGSSGSNGTVFSFPHVTLSSAGTYHFALYCSTSNNSGGSSPAGNQQGSTVNCAVTTPITAATLSTPTYNGSPQTPTVISITPSGATSSVSATAQTAAGSYTASVTGTGNYTGTLSNLPWTINKASQSINFANPSAQTYGVLLTLTATASSGLAVSYVVTSGPASVSGSTVTFTGTGSVTITASQAGNGNYTGATPVGQTFTVNPANTSPGLKVLDPTP